MAPSEVMKKKNWKKKKAVWINDWLERREEKGAYNNIISDCHHFHQGNLIGAGSGLSEGVRWVREKSCPFQRI